MEDLSELFRNKDIVISWLRYRMLETGKGRVFTAKDIGITTRSLARILDGKPVSDKIFFRVIKYLGLEKE